MNIVFLDSYAMTQDDQNLSAFNLLGHVMNYERTSPSEVVPRSKDADILVINKIKVTAEVLELLPRLKMICVSATGYNVVDTEAARQHGIIVSNVPDYCSESVAQIVFAHLFNITNSVAHYAKANNDGRWCNSSDFCYQDVPTLQLAGKTMGIVGMGNIGSQVADIALALRMKVCAYTSKSQAQLPVGVEKKSLETLLSNSDVITLHCPLTANTENLINADRLRLMKPSAILINTARGPLINEAAVAEALLEGRLAAFAADVLCQEPPEKNCPLLHAPNVYLTPHIAWATYEARQKLIDVCAKNVSAFISGKPINVVN